MAEQVISPTDSQRDSSGNISSQNADEEMSKLEQTMLNHERNLALREWMLNQKEEQEKRGDGRVAATGEHQGGFK